MPVFDGSTDEMNVTYTSGDQSRTYLCVGASLTAVILPVGVQGNGGWFPYYAGGTTVTLQDRFAGSSDSNPSIGVQFIANLPWVFVARIEYPGNFSAWIVNRERVLKGSAAIGSSWSSTAQNIRLGASYNYARHTGPLAEVIVVDSVMTDAEINESIKHLAWKWDLGGIPAL